MPPVHLQMILILKLADPYPVLHLQLDKSTCQAGGWSTGKFYPRIFKECLPDRASKLRFFKFFASNENERCLVHRPSIVRAYSFRVQSGKITV